MLIEIGKTMREHKPRIARMTANLPVLGSLEPAVGTAQAVLGNSISKLGDLPRTKLGTLVEAKIGVLPR